MSKADASSSRPASSDLAPGGRPTDSVSRADRSFKSADQGQSTPAKALDRAVSQPRDTSWASKPSAAESRLEHAVAPASERSGPGSKPVETSAVGRVSDALDKAVTSGKEAVRKAGEKAGDVLKKGAEIVQKGAVTAAVAKEVFVPGLGGLPPRAPDYGPARNDATSSQRVEIESPVDAVEAFSAHVSENEEHMGISDDVNNLDDWERKRQEDRMAALGDDRGKPESSLHDDPPEGT